MLHHPESIVFAHISILTVENHKAEVDYGIVHHHLYREERKVREWNDERGSERKEKIRGSETMRKGAEDRDCSEVVQEWETTIDAAE